MESLVAVLWLVYLTECLGRLRPREWVFRGRVPTALVGKGEPDVLFMAETLGFVWLSVYPGSIACRASGTTFDVGQAKRRIQQVNRAVRPLSVATSALFWFVLVGFSVLVWTGRTAALFAPWAVVAVALWFGSTWLFLRAYRTVYGRLPPAEVMASHVLSPVSLMRGGTAIYWTALDQFHPLSVAAATCADEEFLRIARVFHYDEPQLQEAIKGILTGRRLFERFSAQPDAEDASAVLYCPRCHSTYGVRASRCADCRGVALFHLRKRGRRKQRQRAARG